MPVPDRARRPGRGTQRFILGEGPDHAGDLDAGQPAGCFLE